MHSKQADPSNNLDKIEGIFVNESLANPPNTILVTPELSTTGYLMHDDIFELAEEVPKGPISKQLIAISKKYKSYIVAGIPEKATSGILYNTAIMVGPSGYLGKSRKILVPNYSIFNEKRYFKSAQSVNVINTPLGIIGLQICYDLFDPSITKCHALMDAHTSICISASPGIRSKYFETFIPSRAMENTINIVYVNQSGIQDDLVFWGGSEIRTSTGRRLIKLRYDEEDYGLISLDTSNLDRSRAFVPTLRDQSPWIFKKMDELNKQFTR